MDVCMYVVVPNLAQIRRRLYSITYERSSGPASTFAPNPNMYSCRESLAIEEGAQSDPTGAQCSGCFDLDGMTCLVDCSRFAGQVGG